MRNPSKSIYNRTKAGAESNEATELRLKWGTFETINGENILVVRTSTFDMNLMDKNYYLWSTKATLSGS